MMWATFSFNSSDPVGCEEQGNPFQWLTLLIWREVELGGVWGAGDVLDNYVELYIKKGRVDLFWRKCLFLS